MVCFISQNDIQHISNDISDQASESQSARSEIHETILSTGSATSGTRAANLKMPSVPLTINHVFPSEGDEGLPGMILKMVNFPGCNTPNFLNIRIFIQRNNFFYF